MNGLSATRVLVLWACIGAGGFVVGSAHGDVTSYTIVKPGDPVPGMDGFTFSSTGGIAGINDDGRVLINATIVGPGSNSFNDQVVVRRDRDGTMVVMAREGDPVPGLAGTVYRGGSGNSSVFHSTIVTPGGDFGLQCEFLSNGVTLRTALMSGSVGGGFTVVGYTGMQAPGYDPGDAIQFLGLPGSIHDGGAFAFLGRMNGSQSEDVMWFGAGGVYTAALQSGLQAPGLAIGATIGGFDRESLRYSALGEVAFGVTLDLGSGITQTNRSVLYSGDPTNLGILAQTGTGVDGLAGATYVGIDHESARINAAGAVAFQALVSGGGTGDVIMGHGGGVTMPIAIDGQAFPGMPGIGIDFNRPDFEMNAGAEVVFTANLTGAPADSDTAVIVTSAGVMRIAVREGDVVDGRAIEHISLGAYSAINDRGDVLAEVSTDGRKTWVVSPGDGSGLVQVLRAGDVLVTGDGFSLGLSTTNPWSFQTQYGSTGGGVPVIFNNEGEIVLTLIGGFGRGTFVLDFDGVPPVCVADLSGDGLLDFFDVSAFLSAFGAGDLSVDFNDDGLLDFFDVSGFLSAFSAGCP